LVGPPLALSQCTQASDPVGHSRSRTAWGGQWIARDLPTPLWPYNCGTYGVVRAVRTRVRMGLVVRATEDPPRSRPTSRHLTSPLTVPPELRRCRLAWRSPPTRSHGGSQGFNSLPPPMTDEARHLRALPRPDGGCTAPSPLLAPSGEWRGRAFWPAFGRRRLRRHLSLARLPRTVMS
jgi:hypothetical protein